MINKEYRSLIRKIKDKLSGQRLDSFELFLSHTHGLLIEIKDKEIDVFSSAQHGGVSLRVIKDKKPGFSFCTQPSAEIASALVDRALLAADSTDPDPFISFPSATDKPFPVLNQFDETLETIPLKEKIETARRLEAAAKATDRRIRKVRKASYQETTRTIGVINSMGVSSSYSSTLVAGSIYVVAEEGNNAEAGWDYDFSPFFQELDLDAIGQNAAQRALTMLGARSIETIKVPAILPPHIATEILNILSGSFRADNVQKGKSMLIGRIGSPLFSHLINIVDDGLYPGGIASAPFDDEGTPRTRTVLVTGGVPGALLYDQYTANKSSTSSTGNAGRASIKTPPSVTNTNFYIKKGQLSVEELLSSITKGFMVMDIMGIHTADPISGQFSVGASGLWIQGGEIAFPVKGVAISGNILDIFKNVDGVGNDLRFYGSFGSPTLRVSELQISGR